MTNHSFFENILTDDDLLEKGSDHYKQGSIQPIEFINSNNLPFCEGNVVKYITRHSLKGKKEDVLKAIHYCQFIIRRDYK